MDEFSSVMENSPRYKLLREFDCSYGIADLVLFAPTSKKASSNRIGDIPHAWAYALRQLPYRKTFSASDFSLWNSVSLDKARDLLKRMNDADFIKPAATADSWIKTVQPQVITNEIIAIEAKLNKWRQALSQATRYRHFAHQSWVLLDGKNKAAAINNIQDFQRFNIGLVSLSGNGRVNVHFSPIKSAPKSPRLFWMANSKLAGQLKSQVPPEKSIYGVEPRSDVVS